ncbi:hypothetical protein GW17_00009653 [Ensete ventricosum]|nr:hypothetical protein GW17_00009653 [Ensete ventricosum]RZS05920.1 hypothetical protein BHM03_00036487 [Ensete ventricosum]
MGTEALPAETLPRVRLGDRQGRRIIVIHPGPDKAKWKRRGEASIPLPLGDAVAVAQALWSASTPQRLAICRAWVMLTLKALRTAVLLKMVQRQSRSSFASCFSGPQHVSGGVVVEFKYFPQPNSFDAHCGVDCAADPVAAAATTTIIVIAATKLMPISAHLLCPLP